MSFSTRLQSLCAHPLTRGLDLDDPATTLIRREIIKQKDFCRRLYLDFYQGFMAARKRAPQGKVLELGSGGGFLKRFYPRRLFRT